MQTDLYTKMRIVQQIKANIRDLQTNNQTLRSHISLKQTTLDQHNVQTTQSIQTIKNQCSIKQQYFNTKGQQLTLAIDTQKEICTNLTAKLQRVKRQLEDLKKFNVSKQNLVVDPNIAGKVSQLRHQYDQSVNKMVYASKLLDNKKKEILHYENYQLELQQQISTISQRIKQLINQQKYVKQSHRSLKSQIRLMSIDIHML